MWNVNCKKGVSLSCGRPYLSTTVVVGSLGTVSALETSQSSYLHFNSWPLDWEVGWIELGRCWTDMCAGRGSPAAVRGASLPRGLFMTGVPQAKESPGRGRRGQADTRSSPLALHFRTGPTLQLLPRGVAGCDSPPLSWPRTSCHLPCGPAFAQVTPLGNQRNTSGKV